MTLLAVLTACGNLAMYGVTRGVWLPDMVLLCWMRGNNGNSSSEALLYQWIVETWTATKQRQYISFSYIDLAWYMPCYIVALSILVYWSWEKESWTTTTTTTPNTRRGVLLWHVSPAMACGGPVVTTWMCDVVETFLLQWACRRALLGQQRSIQSDSWYWTVIVVANAGKYGTALL